MSQINVNPGPTNTYDDTSNAQSAVAGNLTWAIAMVLIIAAIAIAIVYVVHSV